MKAASIFFVHPENLSGNAAYDRFELEMSRNQLGYPELRARGVGSALAKIPEQLVQHRINLSVIHGDRGMEVVVEALLEKYPQAMIWGYGNLDLNVDQIYPYSKSGLTMMWEAIRELAAKDFVFKRE